MLNSEIKKYIDKSVLCWLATSNAENIPNVSPKEIFNYFGDDSIIIANIASLQSLKNIQQNNNVCVSFIDVLVQKGFQIKGTAEIIMSSDTDFKVMAKILEKMTKGKFPFSSITKISVKYSKPIIAPRYLFYPKTTEEEQVKSACKSYGF